MAHPTEGLGAVHALSPVSPACANRREFMQGLLLLPGTSAAWASRADGQQQLTQATSPPEDIAQPGVPSHEAFMDRAFEMRRIAIGSGDQPYGAIIVKDSRIVGLGPSQVVVRRDPTAHAEMEAIRDACRRLGTRDLSGGVIYASTRPCRMCETACYYANLSGIYYGAAITDAGTPRSSC